ncbi:MAG: hypothetical protein Q8L54_04945 [Devosia sp.]|nr:hypothetical protein [Devosia sp.]
MNQSRRFDSFPFPFPDPDERLKADIAEKLDAHRKSVQATHPDITLTEMYNLLEKLRAGSKPAASTGSPSPLAGLRGGSEAIIRSGGANEAEEGARRAGEGSGRVARDPSSAPGSSPGVPPLEGIYILDKA